MRPHPAAHPYYPLVREYPPGRLASLADFFFAHADLFPFSRNAEPVAEPAPRICSFVIQKLKQLWKEPEISQKSKLERDSRVLFLIADCSRPTFYLFIYIKSKLAYLMLITFVMFRVFISLVYKLNSHTRFINAIVLNKRCPLARDPNLERMS